MRQRNKSISMTALILLLAGLIFTSTSAFAEVNVAKAMTVAALDSEKTIIHNDGEKKKKGKGEEGEPDCE